MTSIPADTAAAALRAIRGGVQPRANELSMALARQGIPAPAPGHLAAIAAAYQQTAISDPDALAEAATRELTRQGTSNPDQLAAQIEQVHAATGYTSQETYP